MASPQLIGPELVWLDCPVSPPFSFFSSDADSIPSGGILVMAIGYIEDWLGFNGVNEILR